MAAAAWRHFDSRLLPPAMDTAQLLSALAAILPIAAMLLAALVAARADAAPAGLWRHVHRLSAFGLLATIASAALHGLVWGHGDSRSLLAPWLQVSLIGSLVAVLVQLLGVVLGHFSARYLQGEPRQGRYMGALACVLAAVQLLLLADHWLSLIAAWAAVGLALERLLCFYADRPFALLAAHKKRLADRAADALLLGAAALSWSTVGSGSFSDLFAHLASHGATPALQWAAVLLAAAVVLRTALLPVHGWLLQVMEAPTPVSALLHAGVVNLGGYVLIRLWPLLEQAPVARWLLVALGAATAVLAGLVMLTRVSIKLRLAWSTVAQMGFMVMECGLGLTTLALLHLIGHSLYKSHAFLMASDAVRQARLQDLRGRASPSAASLLLAPWLSVPLVVLLASAGGAAAWPWWWSVVLGLAWAPLLWRANAMHLPDSPGPHPAMAVHVLRGLLLAAGLTLAARLAHSLPWGLVDAPATAPGLVALACMVLLYGLQAALLLRPAALPALRRWSYAGFYLDEVFTRLALRCGPSRWAPAAAPAAPGQACSNAAASATV
jgi:NAD(P)H-quinone oxidoreductase subunit 5